MTMSTTCKIVHSNSAARYSGKPRVLTMLLLLSLTACGSGCSMIRGVPISRVPRDLLYAQSKDDFKDISLLRLRRDPPAYYALGAGDTVGVYVPEIIGYTYLTYDSGAGAVKAASVPKQTVLRRVEDDKEEDVQLTGDPVVIDREGMLKLPAIDPIRVSGMSVEQAEAAVQQAYLHTEGADGPILREDSDPVILTLHRKRTVRILVIREESGGVAEVTKRGSGEVVDLAADEADLLHVLNKTGGMPGLDAENQVRIYRGMFKEGVKYDQILNAAGSGQDCLDCNDSCFCNEAPLPDPPTVTRIPLRYHPSEPPNFTEEDITLQDRDVVIIRSRDTETFYTAGFLGGGEHLLPRDKDLDVIAAIAVAGGPIGNIGTGFGGIGGQGGRGGGGRGQFCEPTEVILIRELPCGDQIAIKIDLNEALENPAQRVLIKPNDVIMLRYTLTEEISNVLLRLIRLDFLYGGGGFGGR